MINEITINSSNTIDLSRGELLNWLNELLKTNIIKIEQLGTGAIYCQLTDVLYPNKIPLNKVNWKAKHDYQFVVNFKILQQSFTKLNILKHIDVQKLIKCKYQDNLQFLQWFRKMFQNCGNNGKDYNPVTRRGDNQVQKKKEKQNSRGIQNSTGSRDTFRSNSRTNTQNNQRSTVAACQSFMATDQNDLSIREPLSHHNSNIKVDLPSSLDKNFKCIDSDWKYNLHNEAFQQQKEFYLKKFKQIQHLCEQWKTERPSSQLIKQMRKIILVAPAVEWSIEEGQYMQKSVEDEKGVQQVLQ